MVFENDVKSTEILSTSITLEMILGKPLSFINKKCKI